jgi:hypothetical protein
MEYLRVSRFNDQERRLLKEQLNLLEEVKKDIRVSNKKMG